VSPPCLPDRELAARFWRSLRRGTMLPSACPRRGRQWTAVRLLMVPGPGPYPEILMSAVRGACGCTGPSEATRRMGWVLSAAPWYAAVALGILPSSVVAPAAPAGPLGLLPVHRQSSWRAPP